MVRSTLDQLVLQGQLGEGPQFVVVLLFGVTADDVVGLLLALVYAEALEALTTISY